MVYNSWLSSDMAHKRWALLVDLRTRTPSLLATVQADLICAATHSPARYHEFIRGFPEVTKKEHGLQTVHRDQLHVVPRPRCRQRNRFRQSIPQQAKQQEIENVGCGQKMPSSTPGINKRQIKLSRQCYCTTGQYSCCLQYPLASR